VEQVYVTGLAPGAKLSLLDDAGGVVASRDANNLGGALFREVRPGDGYRVRLAADGATSKPLTVLPSGRRRRRPTSTTRRSRPARRAASRRSPTSWASPSWT